MRKVELARAFSWSTPGHQEFALFVELHDARIDVSITDEERYVGKKRDVRRPGEMCLIVSGNAGFSERSHQLLAVVGELENLVPVIIDHPNVPLRIIRTDADVMRTASTLKQLVPLRPRLDHLAVAVKNQNA